MIGQPDLRKGTHRTSSAACHVDRSAALGHPLKLLHAFPSFAVGGAQIRFARLGNALAQSLEHVVISMDGTRGSERSGFSTGPDSTSTGTAF